MTNAYSRAGATAGLALASALALAACAPPASNGGDDAATWVEPDLYTVDAMFSGAWFYTGWFEIVVDNGIVIKAYPIDDDAKRFAADWDDMVPDFFEAPGDVLNRATDPNPDPDLGLELEYTIQRSATGAPLEICWDDPQAVDEEGCWTWTDYRGGDVATEPTPGPTDTPTASATWTEPANYDYVVSYSAFSTDAGTYTISVRDHQVTSVTFESVFENGEEVEPNQSWTLGELVALYDEAAAMPDAEATITFDEATGAPSSITLDWLIQAADDEQYFTIEKFTPLP